MVVLILERVPNKLRGELTRWMLEPQRGVFVGGVAASVRDLLWDKACRESGEGGCILIHSSNTEQGFRVRSYGRTARRVVDFDGLQLISHQIGCAF